MTRYTKIHFIGFDWCVSFGRSNFSCFSCFNNTSPNDENMNMNMNSDMNMQTQHNTSSGGIINNFAQEAELESDPHAFDSFA